MGIQLACLIVSVILHELAHGYTAQWLGDPTAKNQGRLTLNPMAHLDPVGSVLLPGLAWLLHSPILFGWAKPVPINPRYFQQPMQGMMVVALAGPISNVVLAGIGVLCLKLFPSFWVWVIAPSFIQINIVLALFNLLPIPPLDGSRVLAYFAPSSLRHFLNRIEPFGFVILFALLYFNGLSWLFEGVVGRLIPWIIGT